MRVGRIAGLVLLAGLFPLFLRGLEKVSLQAPSGAAVGMSFRSLEPGEVILFDLQENPDVRRAVVEFLGQRLILRNTGEGGASIALVGVGLGTKPGAHYIGVTFDKKDGKTAGAGMKVEIRSKTFPARNLTVAPEYVTPPKEAAERIQREAEIVEWACSHPEPGWLGEGGFVLPHGGKIWPNFGQRRLYNKIPRSTHMGVDIDASMGDPISASNSGKVVLASDLYLSGKTVVIDHGLGVFTFYGHMSQILVKRGDGVKKGQAVGRAGSTGRSTGPHLHWGVRVRATRADPLSLLSLPLH